MRRNNQLSIVKRPSFIILFIAVAFITYTVIVYRFAQSSDSIRKAEEESPLTQQLLSLLERQQQQQVLQAKQQQQIQTEPKTKHEQEEAMATKFPTKTLEDVKKELEERKVPSECEQWLSSTFNHKTQQFVQWKSGISQNGQDRFVSEKVFNRKRGGVFIDIGAYDGETFSNSWLLEKCYGWLGVCVEPLPQAYANVVKTRSCIPINGAITDFNGNCEFVASKDEMLSGLRKSVDVHRASVAGTEILNLKCYRLETILSRYGIEKVDYMTIDTEGNELQTLKSIDFNKVHVELISVENNGGNKAGDYLLQNGYEYVDKVGADEFYRRK